MKSFLISTLLCLFTLLGHSQNGGQYFENNVIKVEYLGYQGGSHLVRVCNKQTCKARIRTKVDQDPAVDIQVPANSCLVLSINKPSTLPIVFRAKAETACIRNPDMGWLELELPLEALPIKFKSFQARKVDRNTIQVIFEAEEDSSIRYYRIMLSFDGRTYQQREIVLPEGLQGNRKYYVNIKINE